MARAQVSVIEPQGAAKPLVAVVIASRETAAVLRRTVAALLQADTPPTLIDVLVNGNPVLAAQMAEAPEAADGRCRLWHHPLADKANSINHYLQRLWPGGAILFVDGYVRVRPDAPRHLVSTLGASPLAHAAAALPSVGRSAPALARKMQIEGGIHGNLFALRDRAARTFLDSGCRLPVGMYRVDSTLGSILAFDFKPERQSWAPTMFIAVSKAASWDIDVAPPWRYATLTTWWRRRLLQARGQVENWAVRHWMAIEKNPPSGLQTSVHLLLETWQARDPVGWRARLHASPLRALAVRRLRSRPIDLTLAAMPFLRTGGGAP